MAEFADVLAAVFEEEGDEAVFGGFVIEADGGEFVGEGGVDGAGAEFLVGAHPDHFGERLAGEDPFVVSERIDFDVLDDVGFSGFDEPGDAGVEAVFDIEMDAGGGEDGVDGGVGKAPAADDGAERAADDFVVGARVPEGDAHLLDVAVGDVVVGPIDSGWLAVAFAAGEEFEAVFAFEREAFELAHLTGEGGLEEIVFDVEGEAFAGGFEVGGVVGEFGIGVAVEEEKCLALVGAAGGEEDYLAEAGGTSLDFGEDLGGDFAEGGAVDLGDAEFAGEGDGFGAENEFDGFGRAADAGGFIEVDDDVFRPAFGPLLPGGGEGDDVAGGAWEGGSEGVLFLLGLLDGAAGGGEERTGEAEILLREGLLGELHFPGEGVGAVPVAVFHLAFGKVIRLGETLVGWAALLE